MKDRNRMMIVGSNPFYITKHSFAIGKCTENYTLQMSVDYDGDGNPSDFTWEDFSSQIAANSGQHIVTEIPANLWWRLNGSTSNVFLKL